jgi:hypothetical protein
MAPENVALWLRGIVYNTQTLTGPVLVVSTPTMFYLRKCVLVGSMCEKHSDPGPNANL